MKRKVIQQNSTTLVMSLPKKWVSKNNINKGDYLEIIDNESFLKVLPLQEIGKKTASIDLSKTPFLKRYINMAYVLGYDCLLIKNFDQENIDEIKKASDELLGFEIIDQTNSTIRIEMLSKPFNGIDANLRRIFHLLKTISSETTEKLRQQRIGSYHDILHLDYMVDKLRYLCCRQINVEDRDSDKLGPHTYMIISQIEQVCDEYRNLLGIISKDKIRCPIGIIDIMDEIYGYIELVVSEYYNLRIENIGKLKRVRIKILRTIEGYVNLGKKNEAALMLYPYSIVNLMRHIEGNLRYFWD